MFFTDDDIRRIKDASTGHLLNVVQDFQNLRKSGTSYVCDCPHCKASKKFSVNPAKDIYNCFSCHQIAGVGALDYLMRVEGSGRQIQCFTGCSSRTKKEAGKDEARQQKSQRK